MSALSDYQSAVDDANAELRSFKADGVEIPSGVILRCNEKVESAARVMREDLKQKRLRRANRKFQPVNVNNRFRDTHFDDLAEYGGLQAIAKMVGRGELSDQEITSIQKAVRAHLTGKPQALFVGDSAASVKSLDALLEKTLGGRVEFRQLEPQRLSTGHVARHQVVTLDSEDEGGLTVKSSGDLRYGPGRGRGR